MEAELRKQEDQLVKIGEEIIQNESEVEPINSQLENQDRVEERARLFESYFALSREIESLRSQLSDLDQPLQASKSIYQDKELKLSEKQDIAQSISEYRGILQTLSTSMQTKENEMTKPIFKQIESQILDMAIQYNLSKDMAQ